MSSFCRYRVKKPRKATALLRFFLVPTKIWHFKTAKHPKSFSFRIIGCFCDAPILLVLQGEKRPKMGKIKFLGRVHPALLSLRLIYSKKHQLSFFCFLRSGLFLQPPKTVFNTEKALKRSIKTLSNHLQAPLQGLQAFLPFALTFHRRLCTD